ncbi:sororin [Heptranchias perlo]|uniref:sororin n=1 Tax=Heptranchias perlo TaxID=212740 RepID=UPI00355ACA6D
MAAAGSRSVAADVCPPARRKSDRLSATKDKASSAPVVKRSIVLKKIEPQKNVPKKVSGEPRQSPRLTTCVTTAPRRSPRISPKAMKENVCGGSVQSESVPTSGAGLLCTLSSASTTVTPSTKENGVLPDTVPTLPGDRDSFMPQKVRRSYSRTSPFGIHAFNTSGSSFGKSPCSLSDASDTSTPNQSLSTRRSFFGFEKLLSNDALLAVSPVKSLTPKEKSVELPARAVPTAASLVQRDVNIPGVAIVKAKRKKRKVPHIEKLALDEWAAQMNASFEEAERFDLVVE